MSNKFELKTLLAVGLCIAALSMQAQATPIQYNVDISGGDNSITGTVTTNGNLGQLVPADITGYDLFVKENTKSFELTGLNSTFFWFPVAGSYDPITATAIGLFEDFNMADGFENETSVILQANDQSIFVNGHVFSEPGHPDITNGYFFHTDPNSSEQTSDIPEPEALFEFGTVAATPIPAALPMFAGGLGFVFYLTHRKKQNGAVLSVARPIFAAGLALLFGIGVAPSRSSATVISEVYGGGGNSGATYTNDFIDIFNNGTTTQSLNGLSVQYGSAIDVFTGSDVTDLPSITLNPGQYFLIQEAAGVGGTTHLPSPDAIGTTNLSAISGVVALVNSTTSLNCGNPTPCPPSQLAAVIDLVGYGTANLFGGAGPAEPERHDRPHPS